MQTDHQVPPIVASLNAEQQQAVLHTDGPVLILAGAGSGKTRTLTHRIAYLLQQGIAPWQIVAVTFTNKAASEMKQRVASLLHITEEGGIALHAWGSGTHTSKLPIMGTFHSLCVRMLRRDIESIGRERSFNIYDSDDQEKIMKQVLKDLHIDEAELKARPALSYVSRLKSEGLTPAAAREQATTDHMQRVIRAYEGYQAQLRRANGLDFDDLILETVRMLHEAPAVLERYQQTWRYIHVDEYQDTNHAQYELVTLLAAKERNVCVIGDPDQSIYGFRGADIRNILEFEKDYPDAVRIKLERNYRSTQQILSAADAVISKNPDRPDKHMWTDRQDGPLVVLQEVRDERREAEETIRAIRDAMQQGTPLREQVILYRTHAQSRLFEEACLRNAIPYRLLGGVKFYGRAEVKDVLAYLHAIQNPRDTVSLLRIINTPSRKIGATTMGRIQAYANAEHLTLWQALCEAHSIEELDRGVRERILAFTDMIHALRVRAASCVVSELAEELLQQIAFEKWLKQNDDGEERWHNVQELQTVMHKYDMLSPQESLQAFLEEAALVSEADRAAEGTGDALTLMTLHLCKGLEYEHVLIVGCEEGIFPHQNSLFDRAQLEEERRIMYVGMTRAKTQLRLLFAQSRYLWGEQKNGAPSRFLNDLPEVCVERRSEDMLSAFAWAASEATHSLGSKRPGMRLEPFRQHTPVAMEFSQEIPEEDGNQDRDIDTGSRVEHRAFGRGTVLTKRGDIVDIQFDNGQRKSLALSIAPLRLL